MAGLRALRYTFGVKPLRDFLNRLEARYHQREFLASDPLEFVHHYARPPFDFHDQEVVALVSALLAYGNVRQIRRSVSLVLERMETVAGSPSAFVRGLGRLGGSRATVPHSEALKGWVHRFNTGEDLLLLLQLLAESWFRFGSLGAHFNSLLAESDEDIGPALSRLMADWKSWLKQSGRRPADSFYYLLTSPADGSCCKRWCMLLRWMGRMDSDVDPGLWTESGGLAPTFRPGARLRARQLVMPLDTHTSRISRYIGLTRRKTVDWKMALEVTEALREFDREDPVRYDFALARLGILDVCKGRYVRQVCEGCELFSACTLARRRVA